ncbi:MAG: DUF2953 domain-containing protein [Butyrivibrio sp.]|nr:DUF2953 domain-containing protein [Butyrivibrio sp.]
MGFLTVLLTVLKIIGIVLAAVIGLIILIVLLVLLSPVSYKGRIKYDGQIDINVKARYLFGIVRAYFIKNGDEQRLDAKLLFFSLLKPKRKKTRRSSEGRKRERFDYEVRSAASEKPAPPESRKAAEVTENAARKELEAAKEQKNDPKEKKSIFKRIKDIYNKIAERIKAFSDMREKIFTEINDEGNRGAVSFALGIVKKLLKHILPRKHRIYVRFGTGDPAATGEILGAAYAFGALLGLNLYIEPDFEHKAIECDIPFKGHVSLLRVLLWALSVYRNRDVKNLLKKFNK